MSKIQRFGVSLDKDLLSDFDFYIKERKYTNRSEAIRDVIRKSLAANEWKKSNKVVAGIITFVYDHHQRELTNKLIHIQHEYHNIVISNQHIHLDHHNCLEVIITKGKSIKIKELFDSLNSIRGVREGSLVSTTTGKNIS